MEARTIERRTATLAQSVAAGISGEVTFIVPRAATTERASVWFPVGSAGELQVFLEILRVDGESVAIPSYGAGGLDYLFGDDVTHNFNVSRVLNEGDMIRARYINTSLVDAHDFVALVDIDFAGGKYRAGVVNG